MAGARRLVSAVRSKKAGESAAKRLMEHAKKMGERGSAAERNTRAAKIKKGRAMQDRLAKERRKTSNPDASGFKFANPGVKKDFSRMADRQIKRERSRGTAKLKAMKASEALSKKKR